MYADAVFSQETDTQSHAAAVTAKDDAHKVALEEMKAKEDTTNKEHETECKKLVEELGAMRQTKVVDYFICVRMYSDVSLF